MCEGSLRISNAERFLLKVEHGFVLLASLLCKIPSSVWPLAIADGWMENYVGRAGSVVQQNAREKHLHSTGMQFVVQ